VKNLSSSLLVIWLSRTAEAFHRNVKQKGKLISDTLIIKPTQNPLENASVTCSSSSTGEVVVDRRERPADSSWQRI
jgi:hypothetical protein